MTVTFDRVEITVPDLSEAVADYVALLGAETDADAERGDSSACFRLANTVIALEERSVEKAHISALVLQSPEHRGDEQMIQHSLGVDVRLCSSAESDARRASALSVAPGLSVDHVVLQTSDAQGCIDLFSVGLGVRLALDKTVEEWGGRMLFFRAGKMTLEVIASDKIESSHFWGIAYQCPDIDAFCDCLQESGIEVTEVREGRKPGTRVATVKSHCLGVPTLLIQPDGA